MKKTISVEISSREIMFLERLSRGESIESASRVFSYGRAVTRDATPTSEGRKNKQLAQSFMERLFQNFSDDM